MIFTSTGTHNVLRRIKLYLCTFVCYVACAETGRGEFVFNCDVEQSHEIAPILHLSSQQATSSNRPITAPESVDPLSCHLVVATALHVARCLAVSSTLKDCVQLYGHAQSCATSSKMQVWTEGSKITPTAPKTALHHPSPTLLNSAPFASG